jgi:hypothetical protein
VKTLIQLSLEPDEYKSDKAWIPETEWRIVSTSVGRAPDGLPGYLIYYTWEQGGCFE